MYKVIGKIDQEPRVPLDHVFLLLVRERDSGPASVRARGVGGYVDGKREEERTTYSTYKLTYTKQTYSSKHTRAHTPCQGSFPKAKTCKSNDWPEQNNIAAVRGSSG